MAPSDVISFDVTFDIAASATGTVVNTATVSATTTDPIGGNDSASATSTIAVDADLSLTKTADTPAAGLGDNVVYTLVVDNLGPSDATNVVITDNLPFGQVLVGTTGCAEDPNGVPTCTVGTIAAGTSATVTVTAQVIAATGFQVNTASVTSDVGDAVDANNASSAGVAIAVIVPTLSEWALLLMALLLAAFGWIGIRRTM